MSLSSKYKQLAERTESLLAQECERVAGKGALGSCIRHSISTPGKRLRPVLCFAAAELFGLPLERVDRYALAIELLHTASLVHDDLPALDDDDMRRGHPTAHTVFGEGVALLSGDYLIARTFSLIASDAGLSSGVRATLIELLSDVTMDLCEGQVIDLQTDFGSSGEGREEQLRICHLKKTAVLFRAAVVAPAIIAWGGRGGAEEAAMGEFGLNLGLIFQLRDDLLDAQEGDPEGDGLSSVAILGRARVEAEVKELEEKVLRVLDPFGERAAFLRELCYFVVSRDR